MKQKDKQQQANNDTMVSQIPQEKYEYIMNNMPISCVDIVLNHKGKVLLVYRNTEPAKDMWYIIGGRVYKGEKWEEAVKRKVKEETGIDGNVIRKIGTYETFFDKTPFEGATTGVHTINTCFVVEPTSDDFEIKLDPTSDDYRWIDSIEDSLDDYVKQVLKDSKVFD